MDSLLPLAIHLLPLLNPKEKLYLAEKCTDGATFQHLNGHDVFHIAQGIAQTAHRREKYLDFTGKQIWQQAERLQESLKRRKISILDYNQSDYPKLLKATYDPPLVLFYIGQLPNPEKKCIGIVGTRRPRLSTKQETALFVREIMPYVGSIVSGLALGIDGMAHRATISAQGHTTAVLGGGFDNIYPPNHKKLAADIVQTGGVLLSEYPPNVQPTKYTFPARNRIIAGLCPTVVIMEAPKRSGALITAELALQENRDVYIHSAGLTPEKNSGLDQLYAQGAPALDRDADLLDLWNIAYKDLPPRPKQKEPLASPVCENIDIPKGSFYDISQSIADATGKDIGWNNDKRT